MFFKNIGLKNGTLEKFHWEELLKVFLMELLKPQMAQVEAWPRWNNQFHDKSIDDDKESMLKIQNEDQINVFVFCIRDMIM